MSVLIHSCQQDLRRRDVVCACRMYIPSAQARELVKKGEITWVIRCDTDRPKKDYHHAYARVAKVTPRSASIEANHIMYAYVNQNKEAQDRIEEFRHIRNEFFSDLTKFYDWDEWTEAKKKYTGRDWSVVDEGDRIKPLEAK